MIRRPMKGLVDKQRENYVLKLRLGSNRNWAQSYPKTATMGVTIPLLQFTVGQSRSRLLLLSFAHSSTDSHSVAGASSAAGLWYLLAQQQLTQRSHKLSASIHDLTQSLEAETRPPARIPTEPSIGERIKSRVRLVLARIPATAQKANLLVYLQWNQSIEYGISKAYNTDYVALAADIWKEGQAVTQRLTKAAEDTKSQSS